MLTDLNNIIAESWRETIDWYIRRCRNLCLLSRLIFTTSNIKEKSKVLDTAYGLWGYIWHEQDLVLLFSHRMFRHLEEQGYDLQLHINYELRPKNFKIIKSFYKRLSKVVKQMRTKLKMGRKWFPEIDLIISKDMPPFTYCLEFKYYHYLPSTWNIIDDLKRKVIILRMLRNHNICENIGLLLLDDAICRRDQILCSNIKNILYELEKDAIVHDYYISYNELYSILNEAIHTKSNRL